MSDKKTYWIAIPEIHITYYSIEAASEAEAMEKIDVAEFSHRDDETTIETHKGRILSEAEAEEITA